MKPARDTWLNPALALVLCAAGGVLCTWLGTPLPWMVGPMLAMAACNFGGARLRTPRGGRQVGQLVIGTALGLYFTPAVAREVLSYWPLLLGAALFAIVLAWGCGWFVARTTDTDRTTAFFASVPGGAAEMAALGERFGARVDRVALAQSLRILAVVIVVPFALSYSGAHGADAYRPAPVALDWAKLALLLAIAAAAGGALALARAPNAFMFGPLFAAIALTASELQLSSVPNWASNLAQLLIGCALGSRFERQFLKSLARYAGAVLASIVLAILLAAAFGAALAWLSGLSVPSLVLATAPGGIAEMCITAKVLQLGVPLVTAAHVTRVVVLIAATVPIFRLARRLSDRAGS
ncbi:MAG: AbrB family transcriptional regulator [Burkholderiales bacterium]